MSIKIDSTGKLEDILNSKITIASADKTLNLSDAGKLLKVSSLATITVPNNATVAFSVGCEISIVAYSSSDVTIANGAGVTINSKLGYRKIDGQYSAVTLKKIDTDEWLLVGALKA